MDNNFNPQWQKWFSLAMLKLTTMQMEQQAQWAPVKQPNQPQQVPAQQDVQRQVNDAIQTGQSK